jgi:FHA domain/zinc-ribbon domain
MARPARGALHCPECGFVNPEGANYCQKCGAFLGEPRDPGASGSGDTTVAYQLDEAGDLHPVDLDRVAAEGGTLVIRSGGGRAGETFQLEGEQTRIGRSPDADVFLDDVTVSRHHALLVRRRDGVYIDDLGSLNGTYINRRRIDSHKLADGDELQIGKYKLTYLER